MEICIRNVAKVLAGVIGGGALVAMGVLATNVGETPAAVPPSAMGPMTGAVTVTEVPPVPTTDTSVLATPKAKPAVKASAYK